MSTSSGESESPVRRIDRILAFMSLGMLALSIVCFFTIMIASWAGMQQADFATGAWPVLGFLVYFAPIVAFVLLMTVIIMTFVRRARANKGR